MPLHTTGRRFADVRDWSPSPSKDDRSRSNRGAGVTLGVNARHSDRTGRGWPAPKPRRPLTRALARRKHCKKNAMSSWVSSPRSFNVAAILLAARAMIPLVALLALAALLAL
jgi:hypothetical protein